MIFRQYTFSVSIVPPVCRSFLALNGHAHPAVDAETNIIVGVVMGISNVGVRGVGIAKAGAAAIAISISSARVRECNVVKAVASETIDVEADTKDYSLFSWLRNVKKLVRVDSISLRPIILHCSLYRYSFPIEHSWRFGNGSLLDRHR